MKNNSLMVLAGAVALTIGLASPALATTDVTVDSVQWTYDFSPFKFGQYGFPENQAPYAPYAGDDEYLSVENPSSPGSWTALSCGGATETTEADNDLHIECLVPASPFAGLDFTASATVFSGDYHSLVGRMVFTLTNSSGAPLTLDLKSYYDTEECNAGDGNIGTSSGDLNTDITDSWMLCHNDNKAVESLAWGNNWLTSFENDNSNDPIEGDVWQYYSDGVTFATGESKTFVFFYFTKGATDHGADFGDTDANLVSEMTTMFDTTTIASTRLWEDLTTVENWTVSPPDNGGGDNNSGGSGDAESSALPNTGVDVAGFLFAGLAVAGLGVLMVARRRATKA